MITPDTPTTEAYEELIENVRDCAEGVNQKMAEYNPYSAAEEARVLLDLIELATNSKPEELTSERVEATRRLAWARSDAVYGYGDRVADDLDGIDETLAAMQEADQEPDEVEVTFHPQVWQNGYAVTSDDTISYRVPFEHASGPEGLFCDNGSDSDALKDHENAPPSVRHYPGPFYISLDPVTDDD